MAPSNANRVAAVVAQVRKGMRAAYDSSNGPVPSLEQRQRKSRIDRGPSTSVWASQTVLPAPIESDARDAVLAAVEALGDEKTPMSSLQSLEVAPINLEWVAVRREQEQGPAPAPGVGDSAREKYNALTQESESSPVTIIFIHGGAFYANGFGTSRPNAAKLSRNSGGARVAVLDYRLAPQYPFPAALLDLLILYLSLLHPPPDSFHAPIPATSIVIAGESTGANISLAFIQLLLQLRHQHQSRQLRSFTFHGSSIAVPIPLPAGITSLCPLADAALCLPSWEANKQWDIYSERAPFLEPDFPADSIWPSAPPRADLYCNAAFLHHPLVSVCLAASWKGSPPMWFAVGQERLADAAKLVAQTAARQGVGVDWVQYERLPHTWPFLIPKMKHSEHVWKKWGAACQEMAVGATQCNGINGSAMGGRKKSRGVWIEIEDLGEKEVDVCSLTELTIEEAREMIRASASARKAYTGQKSGVRL